MMTDDKNGFFAESDYDSELNHLNILDFPVIGIGASAGGLEALQEFFSDMPPDPGAAFVVVQHLSPDYKSLMDELLARFTKMVIHRVEDGMSIEENHIYLIPPRKNMTIFHGKLLLTDQKKDKSLNLPIDIFLRSLARDQEKNAIGIILSGTGSDGTLGIRAIKEYGGMAMVQDDRSAKFDGMPRSSISTGMVDFILPPAKLADELVNYIRHPFIKKTDNIENLINQDEHLLSKVIALLRDVKGVDFSDYKDNTIIRRLEKRISINRFENLQDYVHFLTNNNREISTLFNELLIGVTRFFRDSEAYKKLETEVIPQLLRQTAKNEEIRVWVTACSTGEEAYSIAILFLESMSQRNLMREVKIFATDVDTNALEYAGTGLYPESIASDVSSKRLNHYFVRRDGGYQINDTVRGMIIFAKHDIMRDPPFSKIDLISCRNLLIYLNIPAQQRVLSLFYLSLNENAFLFLGTSESVGTLTDGFDTLDSKAKIYQRRQGFSPPYLDSFGKTRIQRNHADLSGASTLLKARKPKVLMFDAMFDEIVGAFVPPSVIIDQNYDVLHTIHQVNKFITLPVGQVSFNLLKMLPKQLGVMVSSLLRRVEKSRNPIELTDITLPELPETTITVSGRKFTDSRSGEVYFLISFLESDRKEKNKKKQKIDHLPGNDHYLERIEELEKELQFKGESLQATVEELETSNEELQSSNEELIASNEELQSTNEELQSVNEELYTVNSEYVKKIEELTELNADMDNLMKNTHIGTIFLDNSLNIRKTNDVASELTNIRASDIGRPIHHFSFENLYKGFLTDIYKVVEDLKPRDREVRDSNNEWYLVRIIPYRTAENAVEGIIVTFVNITNLKESLKQIDELSSQMEMAMEIDEISWWNWNCKTNKVVAGKSKYSLLGFKPDEIGPDLKDWTSRIHPDDQEKAMQAMRDHLSGKNTVYEVEYRMQTKDGSYLWFRDKGAVSSRDDDGNPLMICGVVMNISRQVEEKLNFKKLNLMFKTMKQGVVYQDAQGRIVDANPAAERMLGLSLGQMKGIESIDPRWKSIHEDGSDFPGDTHPSMVALGTGKEVHDVIMGVYNPKNEKYTWINITAIPLFNKGESSPFQVYTIFDDVTQRMKQSQGGQG